MNVLSNYTTNHRYQPQNLCRFPSAGSNNVVAFKAAPMPFEKMFTTRFLYSLVKEGVTCAYTGQKLIPPSDITYLKGLTNLSVVPKYDIGFNFLATCNSKIFKGKNEIYNAIKAEHNNHPDYDLQKVIEELSSETVKSLCEKEADIVHDILADIIKYPIYSNIHDMQEFLALRDFIKNTYYKSKIQKDYKFLASLEPLVELKKLNINNKKALDKICHKIVELSALYNSASFIIGSKLKKCNSETIAINLLKENSAGLSPISPQNQETQNSFKIMVLNSLAMRRFLGSQGGFKDLYIFYPRQVRKNLQKHISSLIKIQKKWTDEGKDSKANKLAEYILVLKYGHERQVNSLNFNVGELKNSMGRENLQQKVNMVKDWLDIEK